MKALFFAALLLACPVRAVETASKPARTWRYFFAYDYFFPENAGRGLKDQVKAQSDRLLAAGYSSTDYRVGTQGGAGARFGAMRRVDERSELGLSLGYVVGPTMSSNFNAIGGPGPGGDTIDRTVLWMRYLVQGRFKFPLEKRWTFNMGSGFGMATGRVQQTCDQGGTVACPVAAARRTWTGFSWEFTPSVTYKLKSANVEVGARYAGFPEFEGNDQIARISWTTYGLFLGASF